MISDLSSFSYKQKKLRLYAMLHALQNSFSSLQALCKQAARQENGLLHLYENVSVSDRS